MSNFCATNFMKAAAAIWSAGVRAESDRNFQAAFEAAYVAQKREEATMAFIGNHYGKNPNQAGGSILSQIWNSPFARYIVPDDITVSGSATFVPMLGFGASLNLTLLTKGEGCRSARESHWVCKGWSRSWYFI